MRAPWSATLGAGRRGCGAWGAAHAGSACCAALEAASQAHKAGPLEARAEVCMRAV